MNREPVLEDWEIMESARYAFKYVQDSSSPTRFTDSSVRIGSLRGLLTGNSAVQERGESTRIHHGYDEIITLIHGVANATVGSCIV